MRGVDGGTVRHVTYGRRTPEGNGAAETSNRTRKEKNQKAPTGAINAARSVSRGLIAGGGARGPEKRAGKKFRRVVPPARPTVRAGRAGASQR